MLILPLGYQYYYDSLMKTIQYTSKSLFYQKISFFIFLAICLSPLINAPIALLLGFILANTIGNSYVAIQHKVSQYLLQTSVVGLGFGMHLTQVFTISQKGFSLTVLSIAITLGGGIILGKILGIDKITAYLIACGTAICGGSAIAAISPVVRAKEKQISVALGTIFLLNTIALLVFPAIGQKLHLSQEQFGMWCAIAIHDTSSVVGAASKYGNEALQIATTVKLTRALWIIPVALASAIFMKSDTQKLPVPYFIFAFIGVVVWQYYCPIAPIIAGGANMLAKKCLTISLFFIGTSLHYTLFRHVGLRPLLQGISLWVIISTLSLCWIML